MTIPTSQIPDSPLRKRLRALLHLEGEDLIRITTYVIIFIMLLFFITGDSSHLSRLRYYGTIGALAFILVINSVWNRLLKFFPNDRLGAWILLALSGLLMLVTAWLAHFINVLYLFFMIAAQAFLILGFYPAIGFIAVLSAAYMALLWRLDMNMDGVASMASGLLVGLVFVGTLSKVLIDYAEQTRRAERLAAELKQANQELLAARERESQLAVAEERVRLAREIHDGLGHHLTALNIQLQAAAKLIERDPGAAAEAVENSRAEARSALDEVRRSVAVMRRSPLDGKTLEQALSALVENFNRSGTLTARLKQSGQVQELSQAAADTLYRAAQEGLTNVNKHAGGASEVILLLEHLPGEVHLSVRDDGQSLRPSEAVSGFGLAGLQERAAQLGGTLTSGPLPQGGYQIQISIPVGEVQHG